MANESKNEIATREEYEAPAAQVRAAHQDGGLLAVIERVALNPDVDIARMEALLKMRADEEERQRRIAREDRDDEARRAYLSAMAQVQAEIGPIWRNRKNEHTRSTYADLASIEKIVTPILTQHGFSTTAVPVSCNLQGHIRMRLTISHKDGHERHYEDDFPLDNAGSQGKINKTDIQAKGSTQTYGRRYLKADALDLSFTDDRDGNPPPAACIDADRVRLLRDGMREHEANEGKFCAFLGVDRLEDLPEDRFSDAIMALEGHKQKRAQKLAQTAEEGGDA